MLPEVLLRLQSRGLNPKLTVVGTGPEMPVMRQAARELGVLDMVHFTGRVDHRDVPGLIGAADICLDVAPCSPLNHQSTMIKIGEYMAAGRPMVTFALDETRRTAGDCALYARDGDLDSFSDLVEQLCRDAVLRETLSRRAIERVQGLTWERSAEQLRYAYELATSSLVSRQQVTP